MEYFMSKSFQECGVNWKSVCGWGWKMVEYLRNPQDKTWNFKSSQQPKKFAEGAFSELYFGRKEDWIFYLLFLWKYS